LKPFLRAGSILFGLPSGLPLMTFKDVGKRQMNNGPYKIVTSFESEKETRRVGDIYMSERGKYTLKELLAKHNIEYVELYEFCEEVRTEHLQMLYSHNVCTKEALQNVVKFINSRQGKIRD